MKRKGGSGAELTNTDELSRLLGAIDESVRASVDGQEVDGVLERASAAQEEYDYELAHALYKLAVLKSGGQAEAVCRLTGFLVEDYAIFDEAIRLLESGLCEVSERSRWLLATAHEMAGDARSALDVLAGYNKDGHGNSASWARQGKLLLDQGDARQAWGALQAAASLESGSSEVDLLLERCKESLGQAIRAILQSARGALEGGRLEEADELLREAAGSPYLPAEYHRLRAGLDRRLNESRLEQLVDRAGAQEAAGEFGSALDSYREALALDPSCEIAATKVRDLEEVQVREAGQTWLVRGDDALLAGRLDEAVHAYYMAVTRSAGLSSSTVSGGVLLGIVSEFRADAGKVPDKSQAAALVALFRSHQELAAENLAGSEMELRRAGALADSLPAGRSIAERLQLLRQADGQQRAQTWMEEAQELEASGSVEEAIAVYERVARVDGFGEGRRCAERARELKAMVSSDLQRTNTLATLDGLVDEQQFFLALREMNKNRALLGDEPRFAELQEAARRGTQTKFPMEVQILAPLLENSSSFQTEAGAQFLPGSSRLLQSAPGATEWFAVSGRQLLVIDTAELRAKLSVELPPQADLTDKKGFFLSDIVPGDRAGLVVVNFDDDLMLYFQYRRSQFELVNVLPLERFLQQSRRQVTRWYTLNGPEQQIVVCQAPHGGGGDTRIYGLSLLDGRIEHDDEFGYALSNLRRIPGDGARYIIHRMPEPVRMRRPGYFSLMFMDGRLRVVDRLNIGPDDLEGTFIESTRWFRQGPESGRKFFFFRYFDSFTGQLVSRPLAFVAVKPDGELAYAASDSSTLVRNAGDLEAIGEVFVHEGREIMAMLGRKESEPMLFVVELDGFRVLKTHVLAAGRRYVGMAPTGVAGKFVLISMHGEAGDLRMDVMEVMS